MCVFKVFLISQSLEQTYNNDLLDIEHYIYYIPIQLYRRSKVYQIFV